MTSERQWFRGRVAKSGDGPVSVGNIANLITVARILVAPVVLWLIVFVDAGNWGVWRFVAAGLFIVAISTDGVDGALARSRNLITNSGILLDPIADKALTGASFIALAMVAELPWWVVVVILGREVLITVFRLVVAKKKVIPASRGGKAKTIAQAIALGMWLTPTWVFVGEWIVVLNWVAMAVVIVLTVITGIDYLVRGLKEGQKNAQ